MSETERSWLNQPGEGSRAYEAFCQYLHQGPKRTHKATAEALGKSETLMANWSAEHNWVQRVTDYDAYLLNAGVETQAQQMAAVRSKQLDLLELLMTHQLESLKRLKPGQDPSIRWTQATAVLLKGQKDALLMVVDDKNSESQGILERLERKIMELESE